jgi:ABC-type multidrug transport system permease subunit
MAPSAQAVDSYRYLHVTIDTPWLIFVFLFFFVFAPMILSAILYVRRAMKKEPEQEDEG